MLKNLQRYNPNIFQHNVCKQNGSNGKPSALETEPGSPKVSCMGKVLSEKPKGPSQLSRKSTAKKTPRSAAKKNSKPAANKTPAKTEHKGPGCLFRMARILCGSKKRAMDAVDESIRLEKGSDFSVSTRISSVKDVKVKGRPSLERDLDAKEPVIVEKARDTPVPVPVPGIGGIKRFASGRKVEWNFEAEADNLHEEKEEKSLKDADAKERSTLENEKDTPVPVLVLGLGGLKRFASGRKVDWNYETETDGGNLAKDEAKENNGFENDDDIKQLNSLEKDNDTSVGVSVFGVGLMKKFASGRKSDWNFELETNGGCATKEESNENNNTLEKNSDKKEINTLDKEMGMQLPVPVLGIGMMKRFPSRKRVEWSFEVDTTKGCIATNEAKEKKTSKKDDNVKERDTLVAVPVPGIGSMKRFTSGRKEDWNFETDIDDTEETKENKTAQKNDDAKVTNNLKQKDAPAVVSVPRIGSMKRFASGRKVDWNFEVETDNAEEAKEKDNLEKNVGAKENNALKKEIDTPATAGPPGIGALKKFASGRKLDWNFEVEVSHKSGMK